WSWSGRRSPCRWRWSPRRRSAGRARPRAAEPGAKCPGGRCSTTTTCPGCRCPTATAPASSCCADRSSRGNELPHSLTNRGVRRRDSFAQPGESSWRRQGWETTPAAMGASPTRTPERGSGATYGNGASRGQARIAVARPRLAGLLHVVPVLRVEDERRVLRQDPPEVAGDLGDLVRGVRLPEQRELLGQVVLPGVQVLQVAVGQRLVDHRV